MVLLKVLFFEWGHWGINGRFIDGDGGLIFLGGADISWRRLRVVRGRNWRVGTEGRDSAGDSGLLLGELD